MPQSSFTFQKTQSELAAMLSRLSQQQPEQNIQNMTIVELAAQEQQRSSVLAEEVKSILAAFGANVRNELAQHVQEFLKQELAAVTASVAATLNNSGVGTTPAYTPKAFSPSRSQLAGELLRAMQTVGRNS